MSEKSYFSIKKEAFGEYSEKKSLFISSVCPVHSREEALNYISCVKKKYSDARHNAFAYVTRNDNSSGYSDDGEPSGTAGIPVFDMIGKRKLTDIVVVVTRYFGGILLGTGGLVRAYTQSALNGIEKAGIAEFRPFSKYRLCCDYSDYGRFCFEFDKCEKKILSSDFGTQISLEYLILSEQATTFNARICEQTGGRLIPEYICEVYDSN